MRDVVRDEDLMGADRPIPLGRLRDDAEGPAAQPAAVGMPVPTAIALVPRRTAPVVAEVPAERARAAPLSPPDGHPLAALTGFRFRMEVAVVRAPRSGRPPGLGRWLLTYAVVMALILGLIVAFAPIARTPALEVPR